MEYIDIYDENNNPLEKSKEKTQAHEEMDFHRTAHIWIINDNKELLLQKRSANKKSHPNCWDISGAGHIRAGENVLDGAIRELREELGVIAKKMTCNLLQQLKVQKILKIRNFNMFIY